MTEKKLTDRSAERTTDPLTARILIAEPEPDPRRRSQTADSGAAPLDSEPIDTVNADMVTEWTTEAAAIYADGRAAAVAEAATQTLEDSIRVLHKVQDDYFVALRVAERATVQAANAEAKADQAREAARTVFEPKAEWITHIQEAEAVKPDLTCGTNAVEAR